MSSIPGCFLLVCGYCWPQPPALDTVTRKHQWQKFFESCSTATRQNYPRNLCFVFSLSLSLSLSRSLDPFVTLSLLCNPPRFSSFTPSSLSLNQLTSLSLSPSLSLSHSRFSLCLALYSLSLSVTIVSGSLSRWKTCVYSIDENAIGFCLEPSALDCVSFGLFWELHENLFGLCWELHEKERTVEGVVFESILVEEVAYPFRFSMPLDASLPSKSKFPRRRVRGRER